MVLPPIASSASPTAPVVNRSIQSGSRIPDKTSGPRNLGSPRDYLGGLGLLVPVHHTDRSQFRCPTQSWEDLPIGALFQALVRLVLATQRCFPSLEGGTLWNAGIAPLSRAFRSRDPYVYGFCIPHAEKNPYDLSWNRASQADSLSGSPQLPN
jgi:hypothetical protein